MLRPRAVLVPAFFAIAAALSAQTVISTHSGILYFFEGSVFLGGDRLEQKFGRFPDIGEGRELRTEYGRAEVLLTPGVFLRLGDNSAIRMISEQLADTRVELVSGSAIVEVNQQAPDTSVTLMFKQWKVRVPESGVYRLDADPAQLRVYKGQAQVSTDAKADPVTVKDGENLPLASVLVAEQSLAPGDSFKTWAMNRSQAVSADNAIASEILDDPSQMDSAGMAMGGFTYFPLTGVPSLGISNPYGVSFWSPYQPALNSLYFPSYMYTPLYLGWPSTIMVYPRPGLPIRIGTGGVRSPGLFTPRAPIGAPRPIPRPIPRPMPAPHVVGRH